VEGERGQKGALVAPGVLPGPLQGRGEVERRGVGGEQVGDARALVVGDLGGQSV